jgi:hypothetical protein
MAKMIANSLAAPAAKPLRREYKTDRLGRIRFMEYTIELQPVTGGLSLANETHIETQMMPASPNNLTVDRADFDEQPGDSGVHVVYDVAGSDQESKIAHLQEWIIRVSEGRSEQYCYFLCKGMEKFIELDLLRYGRMSGSFTGNRGFGVVSQSVDVLRFIHREITPANLDVAALLELIAYGLVLVNTAYADGDPAFSFCRA